jgi:esterase FrsA
MPYQWPLDPRELFAERYPQMVNTGLPAQDAEAMQTAITDMWPDAPGGWVFEWSQLGARYAEQGNETLATLAYGWAKFPIIADDAKGKALQHQLEHYLLAAEDFPVDFDRRFVELAYEGSSTRLPVHVLAAPNLPLDAPILIASGGVDSWKMDLHALFVAFALNTRTRVIAFDIPGTGECPIPLNRNSVEMIDGLVAHARELGDGRVAHLGISMGGYFSAATGLSATVDAAMVLGGPVESAFAPGRSFQFGMADIVSNAFGFDRQPSTEESAERVAEMSLRPLLDQDTNSPMIVVNGADDIHVPQDDTLVFLGRDQTRVELLPNTGHCAISQLGDVIPLMIDWLNATLNTTQAVR